MAEVIEIATVSSRGQVCIPNSIREKMNIEDGSKLLFVLVAGSIIIRKANLKTFEEITKPLKDAVKKSGLKESEVTNLIHKMRAKKNEGSH